MLGVHYILLSSLIVSFIALATNQSLSVGNSRKFLGDIHKRESCPAQKSLQEDAEYTLPNMSNLT